MVGWEFLPVKVFGRALLHQKRLPWCQIRVLEGRVFNRPEFSGRHDFQAKKFGRQCTQSGSHAVGLQEKSSKNLMQNYITTYVSLTHHQHRSWFLRATASVARLSSVCQSVCHRCIVVINQCEIGPKLLLITYRKSHIGFQMT